MINIGTKNLYSERLLLRRFIPKDEEAMYLNWCRDHEVTKYLCWPAHVNVSITKSVLDSFISSYKSNETYLWAICLKEDVNSPIGTISVVKLDNDLEMIEIGYALGKDFWNKGIMTEALKRVIKFFFDEIGVFRIQSRHDPRNPSSGIVMKKAGMIYEGTLRKADRNNKGICDASYYSILKEDYYK